MGTGIIKYLRELTIQFYRYSFRFRSFWFDFMTAVQLLSTCPKKAVELILKDYGARIGDNCDINTHLHFSNCFRRSFSNLSIGSGTHIGVDVFFDLLDEIIIGKNCAISLKSMFITHQDLGHSALKEIYPHEKGKICIGDNCYLGAGSIILKGVELGEGCVVAAGSVVTKSFPPYSVVAGVPAKIVKMLR